MKKKIFKFDCIFDAYALYQCTYGRTPQFKHAEGRGLRHALSAYSAATGVKKLNILEIMAGASEHAGYVRWDKAEYSVESYTTLDIVDHRVAALSAPGVDSFIQGSCLEMSGLPKDAYNVVLANYFSVDTIHDGTGNHDVLPTLFGQVYDLLPEQGAFAFDFAMNGLTSAICAVHDDDSDDNDGATVFVVDCDSPLRDELGLPKFGECEVRCKVTRTYSRLTGTNTDTFEPFEVYYNDELVAEYFIHDPLTIHYWSETELVRFAQQAGFTDFLFFYYDYDTNTFMQLNSELNTENATSDEDSVGCDVSSFIVAIK